MKKLSFTQGLVLGALLIALVGTVFAASGVFYAPASGSGFWVVPDGDKLRFFDKRPPVTQPILTNTAPVTLTNVFNGVTNVFGAFTTAAEITSLKNGLLSTNTVTGGSGLGLFKPQ